MAKPDPTAENATGFDSTDWMLDLPAGWAEGTRIVRGGEDESLGRSYMGPVVKEYGHALVIEVHGEPFVLLHHQWIITRGPAAAPRNRTRRTNA